MQKFSIARFSDMAVFAATNSATQYLRLEPNGNVFWTIHPELASRWEHAEAEIIMQGRYWGDIKLPELRGMNCYLVEATKEDA